MTYIEKGEEPPSLAIWREAGHVKWDVPSDVKDDIRRACRIEQGDRCAFCFAKLPVIPQLQRIAHVEPRDVHPARALDFSNMVASCSSGRDLYAEGAVAWREQSCDERQGPNPLPVHPFQPDCKDKFTYLGNGAIRPTEGDVDARRTIEVLNLDCERLRRGRMKAIEGAIIERERLNASDWKRKYSNPPARYRPEFWPAIAGQNWSEI